MSAGKYLPTFLLGLREFGDENITVFLAAIQRNISEDTETSETALREPKI